MNLNYHSDFLKNCFLLFTGLSFIQAIHFKSSRENSKINFGLCIKSIERTTAPLVIGFSSVNLNHYSVGVSHINCLLFNEEGEHTGSLLLKIVVRLGDIDSFIFFAIILTKFL